MSEIGSQLISIQILFLDFGSAHSSTRRVLLRLRKVRRSKRPQNWGNGIYKRRERAILASHQRDGIALFQNDVTRFDRWRNVPGVSEGFNAEVEREHSAWIPTGLVLEEPIRCWVRLHRRNHQRAHRDPLQSTDSGIFYLDKVFLLQISDGSINNRSAY